MPHTLWEFAAAAVARPGVGPVLRDLSWAARDGETWAVVGGTGSGKTSLADALLGRHHLTTGALTWPLLDRLRTAGRPVAFASDVARVVSFKEESRLFSYGKHYYQERFNFTDPLDDIALGDYLRAGLSVTDSELSAAAGRLGVGHLLPQSFLTLSNGQVRRARLARALLARPELLILDDPFMGLDAAGRADVADLLGGLVRDGRRLLLLTRPDAVPGWVTHVLELDAGAVRWQGPRGDYRPPADAPADADTPPPAPPGEPVIELEEVTIRYGDRTVLDRVSWTVRAGERWALVGPNGAGKSTLLSLVCGDHPQAYGNRVRLFGRQRGTGETIWDVKRPIGFVSPELHLYYSEPLTAEQAAATGFFDVLAPRPTTPEQRQTVRELFERFGLTPFAARPFARLSAGQQRLVLFVRALVKRPPLLILDEPFQGLDADAVRLARGWLDRELDPRQALVFVTHRPEELPRCVTRQLELSGGRVVGE